MMKLRFLLPQCRIRAWEDVLFEGSKDRLAKPDIPLYERLTEMQILNDCRILLDCVEIIRTTANPDTARRRRILAKDRYAHMLRLKPFAARRQRALIREAQNAYRQMNRIGS